MEAHAIEHVHHGPPEAHHSSRVDARTLGMLLFIISEVMVFGAFFTAYFFIRVVGGAPWPAEGTELPKLIAGINTAVRKRKAKTSMRRRRACTAWSPSMADIVVSNSVVLITASGPRLCFKL